MSQPRIEDLIEMVASRRLRFRPTLRPLRPHTGFLVVEIGDTKPSCVVCGDDVPKGRHYTCHDKCQRKEKLRVKELLKRRKEAQRPKMSLSGKVRDALGGLFG